MKLRRTFRSAFTLMELILALAISGIVLMLVGMAIDMQWRLFDARRTGVEETLIARSVIRQISNDLRSALLHTKPDLEGLDAIASNPLAQASGLTSGTGTGSAAAGTGQGTGQGQGAGTGQGLGTNSQQGSTTATTQTQGGAGKTTQPATGTGGTGAASSTTKKSGSTGTGSSTGTGATAGGTTTTEEQPVEEAAPPVTIVGVYGAKDWLSIDVSRLPRIDEYQAAVAGGTDFTPLDIPSDVKTVSYYIATAPSADETGTPPPVGEEGAPPVLRGLVRQQLSRAITSWNEQGGGAADMTTNTEVLAEEVTAIEFAYFDGTTWYSDWNSTDAGGIPVAVAMAIQVEMKRSRAGRRVSEFMGEDPDSATHATIHRMVVHLPAARKFQQPGVDVEPPAEEGTAETMP